MCTAQRMQQDREEKLEENMDVVGPSQSQPSELGWAIVGLGGRKHKREKSQEREEKRDKLKKK